MELTYADAAIKLLVQIGCVVTLYSHDTEEGIVINTQRVTKRHMLTVAYTAANLADPRQGGWRCRQHISEPDRLTLFRHKK